MKRWTLAFVALLAVLVLGATDLRYAYSAAAVPSAAAADTALSPAMIALGDSIFHGRVGGGICFTCHGPTGKGMPGLAPDLTDATWLHGDGSYDFIVKLVTVGVPKPRGVVAAPMLPKGGAKLSMAQVLAVSAFVYSLSDTVR